MFWNSKKKDNDKKIKSSSVSSLEESFTDKDLSNSQKIQEIKDAYEEKAPKKSKISLSSDETIEFQVIKKLTGGDHWQRLKAKKEKERALKRASIERYHPDVKLGLSTEMVQHRIQDGMTNSIPKKYTSSVLSIILKNFLTYFNILMLVLMIVMIVVKSSLSNFFFAVIALMNLVIGTIQEIRAKKITDRMSLSVSPHCTVIRNSVEEKIKESELVLDDIVIISSGQKVAADCLVKEGLLEANESMQMGESRPIKKIPGDRLLAGSFIVSGSAICQVDAVGEDSFSGRIQKTAKTYKKVTSALNHTITAIIQVISLLVLPLGALMFYVNYRILNAHGLTGIILMNAVVEKTASSIIGMIPSGLVLLTSVALTVGVIRLSQKRVLVQDLYSIERLARVNCICFDKTGTLTDGTLKLEETYKVDKSFDLNKTLGSFLSSFKTNNQTSLALLNAYKPNSELTPSTVLPFSSDRKMSAVTFTSGETYVLGAPEYLIDFSKGGELVKRIKAAQNNGFRGIIFGQAGSIKNDKVTGKFTPKALFIISDHIREDAKDTIKWFKDNQVEIKVISGDSPITVADIARKCGIENSDKYVSLDGLSLAETRALAKEFVVFGRVSPEQKAALIKELKDLGKKVAMTGDGVNDILAMKQADCAVAMASGSDATRSAAHVILLDSDFASMPSIVGEGRRVVNNIEISASLFTMKTFFTILLSLFIDIVFFFNMNIPYPFSPRNLVVLELVPIGLCAFFLALQPNNKPIKSNLGRRIILNAFPGAIGMVGGVITFLLLVKFGYVSGEAGLALEILSFNIAAFIMLFKTCWPFNLYRSILYGLSLTAAFCILFFFNQRSFGIDFYLITPTYWLYFMYVVIGILAVILLAGFVISRIEDSKGFNGKKSLDE